MRRSACLLGGSGRDSHPHCGARVPTQGNRASLLGALEAKARELGLRRLFCLSFEEAFFERNGFAHHDDTLVDAVVYGELVRSPDEGIAEFLDLARVKPNTLGNARLVKTL